MKKPPSPLTPCFQSEERVVVGQIKGPWGLHGALKVEVFTDVALRFAPGSILYLGDRPARIETSRTIKGGLLVKLDTVNDRTEAEALRGRSLTVLQSEVGPLPEGSYYYYQIIDMDVRTEEGEHLGRVKEIISTGANDVYVVKSSGRRDLLVPALAEVVLDVDVQENAMTVRLPEGLR